MRLLGMVRVFALTALFVILFASTGVASAAVEWCTVGSPPPFHTVDSVVGGGSGGSSGVPASAYQTPLVDKRPEPRNGKGLPTNYNALANAAGGMTAAKSAPGK